MPPQPFVGLLDSVHTLPGFSEFLLAGACQLVRMVFAEHPPVCALDYIRPCARINTE